MILQYNARMKIVHLGGKWQVGRRGSSDVIPAEVPGTIHTDLLRAKKIEDPYYADNEGKLMWIGESDWIFSRDFTLDQRDITDQQIDLVCDGLDTLCTIIINGKQVGSTDNAFRTWRFSVENLLKAGTNSITVECKSTYPYIKQRQQERPMAGGGIGHHRIAGNSQIRKSPCNYGWDWGPMCVTCGIWRDIRLEAWPGARLNTVLVRQEHRGTNGVDLEAAISIDSKIQKGLSVHILVSLDGVTAAETEVPAENANVCARISLENPHLWWPNGFGDQPLYQVRVLLQDESRTVVDSWERRIGLRKGELVREPDEWGESFYFSVNGISIFAKGANWIPADTFVTSIDTEHYRYLIKSAADANMNMLRVWGGGIYENDTFYDLCDEYGICVWQDFMFACSAYPAYDAAYLVNVKEEAKDAIIRLRHHACLALWCGNNEVEQIHKSFVGEDREAGKMSWEEYGELFDNLLPKVVAEYDPDTPYWPSSPHSPVGDRLDANNPRSGDAHLWAVWHGRQPFEWYRTCEHRFNSEFGFQSFPEPAVVNSYAPPGERNITSYIMELHQRSAIGNEAIIQYMLSWFKLPPDFEMILWLSQILQGMAMKYAVEHWRRSRPRGMGTLYWQLNDCWPVASWSSIDYIGNWKALQYMAARFYAPVLLSAVEDPEQRRVTLFVTSDLLIETRGEVSWWVTDTGGKRVKMDTFEVVIAPAGSAEVRQIDMNDLKEDNRDLLFWMSLKTEKGLTSEDVVTLVRPKHLRLLDPEIQVQIIETNETSVEVKLTASKPALWVWLSMGDLQATYSDAFFPLEPGKPKSVRIKARESKESSSLFDALKVYSLYDTFREGGSHGV